MKILVVDDNQEITEVLNFYCQSQGINCTIVNDGKESVDTIRSETFDLILLDLAMPYFSGFDVLEFLKQEYIAEGDGFWD